MLTDPPPISLFDVAKRAVEICDPTGADDRICRLLLRFEDTDGPVTAIENPEERAAIAAEGANVELGDPAVSIAVVAILDRAHRRDQLGDNPPKILRLAARAEWNGDPPRTVRDRLAGRGIEA